jgi:quercetin dioxygenase-like cupin family protein
LLDLVEYQDGAVVSRPVFKTDRGSVVVFAFDREQSLSEHTVPHDAAIQVLEGEAEVAVSGNWHRVGPGEMIILPANLPHAVKAVDRFKMVLTMFRA